MENLYYNTLYCIVEKEAWRVEFGLQYTGMYCNRGGWVGQETVLQYNLVGSRFVLQYKQYCEPGVGLCRDTARAR